MKHKTKFRNLWSKKFLFMSSFDPNKPLPDNLLDEFLNEVNQAEKIEPKVELPSNYIILNTKELRNKKKKEALAVLNKKMNRPGLNRTSYGNVLASRMKVPTLSISFSNPKKQANNSGDNPSDTTSENEKENI